jgi:hypothetical protein
MQKLSGSRIMHAVCSVIDQFRIEEGHCSTRSNLAGVNIDYAVYNILRRGVSWYSQFGFKSSSTTPVTHNNAFRQTPLETFINSLSTRDELSNIRENMAEYGSTLLSHSRDHTGAY